MKTAVLFSGGKDSCYALYWAQNQAWDVECLVSLIPEREDSYMFHYPCIDLVDAQAELTDIPLIKKDTKAEKEKELEDLKNALKKAKEYGIEGVISGAVASEYQRTRLERVCHELGLKSFTPLWHKDQEQLLRAEAKCMEIMIVGVYAEGLDERWLGRVIDKEAIDELSQNKLLSPVGEGGEFETLTVNAPFFRERLETVEIKKEWDGTRGQIHLTTKADDP